MNIKKTLIIAVIFIAIVGYYAWDQKRLSEKEAGEKLAGRLIKPESDALRSVVLERADGGKVALERKDGQWMLSEPIQARTDKAAVDSLLRTLDTATREDAFTPKGDLGEYGFDDGSTRALVTGGEDDYSETVILGNKTPDGGKVYARTGSGDGLFTVPATLASEFAKTARDLRDKRLLPANITEATSVTLAFSGQTIQLAKRDGQWNLTEPVTLKGDNNAIGELLKNWNMAKASDFIDTGSQELAAYGLENPFWTGTIFLGGQNGGTSGPLTLRIGDMPSTDSLTRYAMIEGEPVIFQAPGSLMDKLRPTVDDLRDKSLFTLAAGDIGRIVFMGRTKSIELKRDSADLWQFDDGSGDRIDQGTVSRKLSDLLALKATQYFDPAPDDTVTGLERPFVDVTVYSRDGKTSEGVKTASSSGDNEFVYAYNKATGEVVGVDFRAPGKFIITRDDLLDRTLFEIDESLVKSIEIQDGQTTTTLTQGDTGSWALAKAGQAETPQVDASQVMNMLYSLMSLSWDRRLDPSLESELTQIKTQGLEKPGKRYILKDADGAELARLGLGGQSGQNVYVTTGAGDYYVIDTGRFGSFISAVDAVLAEGSGSNAAE